ncbi:hypothetical protein GCM10008015_01000 [Flavobacterium palustre]|uniref:Prenyltransferase n=1 Tax=Flavobacterium palustre TaxID=1476463 RepID=A0ABQ1H831_9FLAO|nr:hypothetical protein [Flavobacterium palustre]GGA63896.1 hypothetical protein GCM10008015_01000 [Flavobacterium palustre]
MIRIQALFDFYLKSSIHVAFSVYALVRMTQFMFEIPYDKSIAFFSFFGTIVGYNFVKYDALARAKKRMMRNELKMIAVLSLFSFVGVAYCFFQLQPITQLVSVGVLALTMLYTLPFFPNRKNARNWAGVKIYIVSLCWVGVTLVLPLINAHVDLGVDFYLKCVQRFILIFVLILIFEIIDLANDDPHLQTVPQQIGVKRTKILGLLLLFPFYFLEFFKTNFIQKQLVVNLVLVVTLSLFLIFSNTNRSKYYTSFWVESIPVFWWLMVVFL